MPRKRTPDQPNIEVEPTATIAVAEPIEAEHIEQAPGFVERLGGRMDRIPTPDPFEIAGVFDDNYPSPLATIRIPFP